MRVDLRGNEGTSLIGYRAQKHVGIVDVEQVGKYPITDFWDPIQANASGRLILDPQEFYILASKEALHIPPRFAAEMVPSDPMMGEFRVHYAGFFDPGFGHPAAGGAGSRAVLEVRSHEVPFYLEDGQLVGRLVYEELAEPPNHLYGQGIGSNYQSQGLKLSKHFVSLKSRRTQLNVAVAVNISTSSKPKSPGKKKGGADRTFKTESNAKKGRTRIKG